MAGTQPFSTNQAQNVTGSLNNTSPQCYKFSNFTCKSAHRQTDTDENITSLAEVIIQILVRLEKNQKTAPSPGNLLRAPFHNIPIFIRVNPFTADPVKALHFAILV